MTPLLQRIEWHKFLCRPPLPSPSAESLACLTEQPVLITGAGGSIGSALALRIASLPARTILLEAAEANLYDLQQAFANCSSSTSPTFYLGSAADRSLLDEIFDEHRPHLVFHAAAFKHVPLLEEQPLAAIANNIFATENLVHAASRQHAQMVLLSTDKAVAPASVMGATKRVAEQLVLTSGGVVVRLGNVLASRGSVAEVFAQQIAAGRPLTLTDPAARRYFLTIAEAVDLLLTSAAQVIAPALVVPDLSQAHFITDLAHFMAHALAPGRDIPIEFTRLRAGDKEAEQLWSKSESPRAHGANGFTLVDSPTLSSDQLHAGLEALHKAVEARDTVAAITALRTLVPDYTPSPVVLTQHSSTTSSVQNE